MYKETSSELSLVMVGLLCVCGGGPGKKVSSIPHWVVCVEKDAVPCVSWQVVSRLYRVLPHGHLLKGLIGHSRKDF